MTAALEGLLGVGSGQFCLLCRFFLDTHSLLYSSRWNLFGITKWLFSWRRWIYKYAKLKTLAQVPIVYHTCTKHASDGQQYRAKKICVKHLAHIGKLRLLHSIITRQTRSQQSFKYRIGSAVIYRCYPALEKKNCFHPSAAWNMLFWRNT